MLLWGPLLLIGGGSGVVPLMAMLRHRAAAGAPIPGRLLFSVHSPKKVIYREELEGLQAAHSELEVIYTFTREQPLGWTGYGRRIDRQMLAEVLAPFGTAVQAFICGPTLLVEAAADSLAQLGIADDRFGPRAAAGREGKHDGGSAERRGQGSDPRWQRGGGLASGSLRDDDREADF